MILFKDSEEFDTLLTNGMFRNREHHGVPIAGSDDDVFKPSPIERKLDQITEKGYHEQQIRVGGAAA